MIATTEQTDIQAELSTLQQRRSEVAADAETAQAELATARENLLSGTKDGAAQMAAAQANTGALQAALNELDQRIARLVSSYDQRKAEKEHARRVDEAARVALEFTRAQEQVKKQAAKLLSDVSAQMEALYQQAVRLDTLAQQARQACAAAGASNPHQEAVTEIVAHAPSLGEPTRGGSRVINVLLPDADGRGTVISGVPLMLRLAVDVPSHTEPVKGAVYSALLAYVESRTKGR